MVSLLTAALLFATWPQNLPAHPYQDPPAQATQQSPPQQGQAAPPYTTQTPEQIQQLVAPIALYSDSLVAQILAASTFPEQIVEADRWVQSQPDLKGEALAHAADGLELCQYTPSWDLAVADLAEVRRRVGDRALRCILRPGPPDAADEGNFARKVMELAAAGADGLAFYNFGHLRRSHLGWIGRALAATSKGVSA